MACAITGLAAIFICMVSVNSTEAQKHTWLFFCLQQVQCTSDFESIAQLSYIYF